MFGKVFYNGMDAFFDNRINYDILITKRKRILSVGGRKVKKMEESFPKAVNLEKKEEEKEKIFSHFLVICGLGLK